MDSNQTPSMTEIVARLQNVTPMYGVKRPIEWDAAAMLEAQAAQLAAMTVELAAAQRDFQVARARAEQMEAERDAAVKRQGELDDALRDMVGQYCSYDGKLDHEFMSAGEHAFDVLNLDYGAPTETLWRGPQGAGEGESEQTEV